MALCNYSGTVVKSLNSQNFESQPLEIDCNDVYILRVGYTTNFYDLDRIQDHKIILEEKRNGSYTV